MVSAESLGLRPTEGYQKKKTKDAFTWKEGLPVLLEKYGSLYLIVFRSFQGKGTNTKRIMELDKLIVQNLAKIPELLTYFGGEPDEDGWCLSFCLWTRLDIARFVTGLDKMHNQALEEADELYGSDEDGDRKFNAEKSMITMDELQEIIFTFLQTDPRLYEGTASEVI